MRIQDIETYLWVANLKSFRHTAEKLNATQPAITNRISKLEESLGVELFARSTRQTELTPKGHELLPFAENMLRLFHDFVLAANSKEVHGILRLGASATIAVKMLASFVKMVTDRFPNITVEVTVDTTAALRDALAGRMVDVAFLMGPVSNPSVENFPLCSVPLQWICSSSFAKQPQKFNLANLAQWPIITFPRNTRPYIELQSALRRVGKLDAKIFPCTSLHTAVQLVEQEVGVAVLPMPIVDEAMARGSIRTLQVDWQPTPMEFTISLPTNPSHPIASTIVELAKNAAQSLRKSEHREFYA